MFEWDKLAVVIKIYAPISVLPYYHEYGRGWG